MQNTSAIKPVHIFIPDDGGHRFLGGLPAPDDAALSILPAKIRPAHGLVNQSCNTLSKIFDRPDVVVQDDRHRHRATFLITNDEAHFGNFTPIGPFVPAEQVKDGLDLVKVKITVISEQQHEPLGIVNLQQRSLRCLGSVYLEEDAEHCWEFQSHGSE